MNGFGTFIDIHAILTATRDAPRDNALRFRADLMQLLRTLEDMHGLPHALPNKEERKTVPVSEAMSRAIDEQRRKT